MFFKKSFESCDDPSKRSNRGGRRAGKGCRSTLPLLQHIAGVFPGNLNSAQCKKFALRPPVKNWGVTLSGS